MAREGPFNGLLGFSQGVGLSAALARLQQQVQATACEWWLFPVTTSFSFAHTVFLYRGWEGEVRDSYSRVKHQGAGDGREGV